MNICQGTTSFLTSPTPGGTWQSTDPSIASISASTGAVTGSNAGPVTIVYTLATGCSTSASLMVNSIPEAITGTPEVCAGLTTQLDNITLGGTWSSSTTVASVNTTGLVTGVAAGTAIITYRTGNNCRRIMVVTVNPLPSLIVGNSNVCQGLTSIYSNANPGGTWTSDDATVASIDGASGVITSGNTGVANITYTLPTGCMRARAVTVQPSVEPITGVTEVCKGATTTLESLTAGGVWMSGNTSVATVDAGTGEVTGVNAGAAVITYAAGTGCYATANVVVNALPANIVGATSVCAGSTVALTNASAGGSWASSDDAIATVSGAGLVTGEAAGSATITYTLPTGCSRVRELVVNARPAVYNVTGGGSYCAGGAGVAVGLDGSESGVTYSLRLGTSAMGNVAGTSSALDFGMKTMAGTYTVRATTDLGCSANMNGDAVISVNALVTPAVTIAASTGDTVCANTSVTFTATATNGGTTPTYVWSVGSATVGTGSTYSYEPVSGDVVSVALTSSAACATAGSVTASKSLTVIPKLTPSVSLSVGPDDTLCQGSTASFVAVGMNGGTAPSYTWLVGGVPVAGVNGPSYSYVPTNGQTVSVRLNSSYRCPSVNNVSSNTITMRIEPQYIPAVSIIAQPGTVINAGQQVTFTTVVTGAGPSPRYQWLIRGTEVVGATANTFTSSDLNNGDSVTCVVWGSGKCGMETINSVVMQVNGTTGVANTGITASDLRLMPNPTTGAFVVSGTLGSQADGEVTLEVTDMLGQVVYRGSPAVRGGVLNERVQLGSNLANGMYMMNVSNGNDRKVFHFVLKQ